MNEVASKPLVPSASRVRWVVLAMVAFAAASAYLTRYCISAANTSIQQDLGFDDAEMGRLMSAFGIGYFLFQIPGGWLGNRIGTRAAFATLSICWSLSNLWASLTTAFSAFWASRCALGVFQAGMVPISAQILRDWIPISWRGFSSATISSCMSIGGVVTLSLTGLLLNGILSWKVVFALYSLVGILWSLGFYAYFRTYPEEHAGVNDAELELIRGGPSKPVKETPKDDAVAPQQLAWQMLTSLSMWGICIQSFFRAAGYVFFATWYFAFLEYAYGINKAQAGALSSLPMIAVILGSLSGGVIVDHLWRRTRSHWISRSGTSVASLTICGAATLAAAWTDTATQLSLVIALGAFFSGIASPAAWTATIDLGGSQTAPVVGTMNMAGSLSGILLPAWLGEWFKAIRTEGGDWNQVIYLHAAFYFIAAICWLPVRTHQPLTGDDHAL